MEEIRQLLSQGKTVRQIVAQTGYSRKQVERVVEDMKRQRKSSTRKLFLIVGLVVVVVAFVYALVSYHNYLIQKANDPATWRPAVRAAIDGVRRTFGSDNWLLENDSNAPEVIQREVEISKTYTERLEAALAANSNVPEVKILKDEFGGKFYTTVFSPSFGGTSRKIYVGSTFEEANKPAPAGSIEVCFFPRNAEKHPRMRGQLLLYDQSWRALMIGALDYPDKRWFDALAIHELWHAHMHKSGAPSATAPSLSDSWISEELQAHDLENKVLDNGTKGEYLKTVRSITSGIRGKLLGEFLQQIKTEHLIQLDKLFGKGSDREGSVRSSQYLITLTNDWLNLKYQGEELQRQQIEAYRTISRSF